MQCNIDICWWINFSKGKYKEKERNLTYDSLEQLRRLKSQGFLGYFYLGSRSWCKPYKRCNYRIVWLVPSERKRERAIFIVGMVLKKVNKHR